MTLALVINFWKQHQGQAQGKKKIVKFYFTKMKPCPVKPSVKRLKTQAEVGEKTNQ